MKPFTSPFALPGEVISATLSGNPCGTLVTYDLTVTYTAQASALTTTETIPPGVYTLKVVTDCGCHSMLTYVPPCTITIPGTYDGGTSNGGTPVPSCDTTRCDKPSIGCLTAQCVAPAIGVLA